MDSYHACKEIADVFNDHQKWMQTLPYFLEFPEVLIGPEKRMLVVSHSCIYSYWAVRDDTSSISDMLWSRNFEMVDEDFGIYNVFGHTPVEAPIIKKWGAMIDTGCVFGDIPSTNENVLSSSIPQPKYGKLTAFNPETLEIIQQIRDIKDK